MTFGAIVTELTSPIQMRYALGPPTETTWDVVDVRSS